MFSARAVRPYIATEAARRPNVAILGSPVAQPAIPESAPRDKALSCNDLSAWSTAPHLPEHAPHARALQRDCAAHPSNYKKLAQ